MILDFIYIKLFKTKSYSAWQLSMKADQDQFVLIYPKRNLHVD